MHQKSYILKVFILFDLWKILHNKRQREYDREMQFYDKYLMKKPHGVIESYI